MSGSAARVTITERQQEILVGFAVARKVDAGLAQRSQIVLLAFEKLTNEYDVLVQKLIKRSYSICHPVLDETGAFADPLKENSLEFYITIIRGWDDGDTAPLLTPRLALKGEGDRIFMQPKITGFYTLDGYHRNYPLAYKHAFRKVIARELELIDIANGMPNSLARKEGGQEWQHRQIASALSLLIPRAVKALGWIIAARMPGVATGDSP